MDKGKLLEKLREMQGRALTVEELEQVTGAI